MSLLADTDSIFLYLSFLSLKNVVGAANCIVLVKILSFSLQLLPSFGFVDY